MSDEIGGLNLCISFLGQNGKLDFQVSCIWVAGDVMGTMISHKDRKPKYVFDKSVVHCDGWYSRAAYSQYLSQGLSQLKASGIMIM